MATELLPGQSLTIVTDGPASEVRLSSEGPGNVLLVRQNPPQSEIHLGAHGVTHLVGRGRETYSVINTSDQRAGVDVRVSGARNVSISPGPATGGK